MDTQRCTCGAMKGGRAQSGERSGAIFRPLSPNSGKLLIEVILGAGSVAGQYREQGCSARDAVTSPNSDTF